MKKLFWSCFIFIDERLKFPQLKSGEIAIQMGFDMDAPVTSDLFLLQKRVTNSGQVIGIEPDPSNREKAQAIIDEKKLNISILPYAISEKELTAEFVLGKKKGWNQLDLLPKLNEESFTENVLDVECKPFDALMKIGDVDVERIGHINMTINGNEYPALLGMQSFLESCNGVTLTIIAGRPDKTGTIGDESDYVVIQRMLNQFGFKTKFKRINRSFWWGFVNNLMLRGKWVFNKPTYGVIMAAKKSKRLKFYQSFS